jgi:hypothetical protein
MNRVRTTLLASLTALTLAAPPALLAGDPPPPPPSGNPTAAERIVARAIAEIREITTGTCRDLERGAAETVARLVRLNRQGAEDTALRAAAEAAIARLANRAEAGVAAINAVRTRAQSALQEAGGTAEQAARVNNAARNGAETIATCRARTAARIRSAVERLIGPE